MPQRPLVRIVLLLAVAGMLSGIAGAVFSGGETAARDPVASGAATTEASRAAATTEQSPAPEAATVEPPPAAAADDPPPQPETTTTAPPPPPEAADDPPPEPETTTTAPPPPEATDDPPEPTTAEQAPPRAAAQLIELLRPLVAAPDPNVPDYDRDHFAGWLDDDGDCINTRHEILQAEAINFSMNVEGCAVDSGEWFDPYTDRTFTNPRDLDVDHVVALADAWVSGAWQWADELLDRFSNDLGNLNAIAAGENRSKSAKGPADYSPTAPAARCGYLVQYATVKIRWALSITPRDFEVVATGLAGCDVGTVPDAPSDTPEPTPTTTAAAPEPDCHPAYEPCLPNLPGDALNCGDLRSDQKPVTVLQPGTDPYRLDRDGDGRGCTS